MSLKVINTVAIIALNCILAAQSFIVQDAMPTAQNLQQRGEHIPMFMSTTETETTSKEIDLTNPRKSGLALMLDDGTRKSHSFAQNTAFVSGFFKGLGTRESYGALLTNLYYVYSAMENSFDNIDVDVVKFLDDEELRRVRALEKDMEYFYGEGWK